MAAKKPKREAAKKVAAEVEKMKELEEAAMKVDAEDKAEMEEDEAD